MNNTSEENYRAMLVNFEVSDLQKLLKAFGKNTTGQRFELQNLALDILSSKPIGLNYGAYLIKILEIHNDKMRMFMQPQLTQIMYMDHTIQVPQQRTQTSMQTYTNPIDANYTIPGNAMANNNIQCVPGSYPPVRPNNNIQRVPGSYRPIRPYHNIQRVPVSYRPIRPYHNIQRVPGSYQPIRRYHNIQRVPGSYRPIRRYHNIQCVPGSYQPIRPNNAVSSQSSSNQHNYMSNMMIQNSMRFYLKTKNRENIPSTLTPEIVAQFKFKKLPFYEVIEDIIKPTLLSGSEECSLATFCSGTREITFVHTMSIEQASLIAMNRNISGKQSKYLYQYQIRFCQPELGRSEVTDFLPIGLHIRIGERVCTLPPTAPTQRRIGTTRRIAGPIDCTQLLKLNPNLVNNITLNWIPDGKNYAVAVFLVKKLSPDDLINKLLVKESESLEETRNYIIKKLADVDPDFATTSYHFSLICPLGKTRMNLPAKSINCDHFQCFDASTFILMNEKKQTWTCPICNKPCLYEDISIQNYFLEVIRSPLLQVNDKEIEILADGSWIVCKENKYIKNMNDTLDTAKPTVSIDLDDSGDEIATKPEIELVLESLGKQESIDSIIVDDSESETATEPTKELSTEDSGVQEFIDSIIVDDSDDETASEPKKELSPEDSGKQKFINSIIVDDSDSDNEIATEPKKELSPEDSGKKKFINSIIVDDSDSDNETATEPKKEIRPEDSGKQEFIDFINLDNSDDETATEPKTEIRPEDSGKQEFIDFINLDNSDETTTDPKKEFRPDVSENQESKNIKLD